MAKGTPGARVGCSIVEAFGGAGQGGAGAGAGQGGKAGAGGARVAVPPPRELEDVLRIEYRTKLLNPK